MDEILRYSGGKRHDPAIDSWLRERPAELRSMAQKWFDRIRHCGDDVLELMHDGCATACIEDAPFAYVGVFRDHVNVGFFHGASLRDPAGLLEGSGKRMRHTKLKPGRELNAAALSDMIEAAYNDMKSRWEPA